MTSNGSNGSAADPSGVEVTSLQRRVLLFRSSKREAKKTGREVSGLIAIYDKGPQSDNLDALKDHVAQVYGDGAYRSVMQKKEDGRWVYDREFGEFRVVPEKAEEPQL